MKQTNDAKDHQTSGGHPESRKKFKLSDEDVALIEHRAFTEGLHLYDATKGFSVQPNYVIRHLKKNYPDVYDKAIYESKKRRKEELREIKQEPWYNDDCTLFWSPKLLIRRGYLKASGAK